MIYFIVPLVVSKASFETFVTSDINVYGLPMYQFFLNKFLLFALAISVHQINNQLIY